MVVMHNQSMSVCSSKPSNIFPSSLVKVKSQSSWSPLVCYIISLLVLILVSSPSTLLLCFNLVRFLAVLQGLCDDVHSNWNFLLLGICWFSPLLFSLSLYLKVSSLWYLHCTWSKISAPILIVSLSSCFTVSLALITRTYSLFILFKISFTAFKFKS